MQLNYEQPFSQAAVSVNHQFREIPLDLISSHGLAHYLRSLAKKHFLDEATSIHSLTLQLKGGVGNVHPLLLKRKTTVFIEHRFSS